MKILHLGSANIFTVSFFKFLGEHFLIKEHQFLSRIEQIPWPKEYEKQYIKKNSLLNWAWAITQLGWKADKIILHSLFDPRLLFILALQPWLLKKCCWVLWGSDLYIFQLGKRNLKWKLREFFRRLVIKKIGLITTTIPGDYKLAVNWYGTKAVFVENLMYKSHLARKSRSNIINDYTKINRGKIIIQIGNSADPSNQHLEIIDSLQKFNHADFIVYCPLSYGGDGKNTEYKEKILAYGKEKLGSSFVPLTDFIEFEQYNNYMASIDVAIFNHNRQQAMGNIIGLLSLGKKVYIRSDITPWKYFKEKNFCIFDTLQGIKLEKILQSDVEKNISLANIYFTEDSLKKSWGRVFNG